MSDMNIQIDPEFANLIPPLTDEEYQQLEASLVADGCRDALVTWDGVLIDGHNRYAMCTRRNIPFQVVERAFEGRNDALAWICTNQMARRNLSPMARGELALRMKSAIAAKAKAQQGTRTNLLANLPKGSPVNTREEISEMAGVSGRTLSKVETISADAPEPVKQQARNGNLSVDRAFKLTQQFVELPAEQRESAARLCEDELEKARTLVRLFHSSGSPETNGTYDEIMSTGGFHYGDDMADWCNFHERTPREIDTALRSVADWHRREAIEARRDHRVQDIQELSAALGCFPVIYADPPWRYEHVLTESRAIENHYPTMTLEAICALKVNEIAHKDAVLFLWATSPKLAEAMQVIEAWGFTYRTCMVWVKDKIGMGRYARQQHELLLIAAQGAVPVPEPSDRVPSVVYADRTEHSAKPAEFYDVIEAMYPEYQKVELFSRTVHEGWTGWGNQYGDS